MGIKENLMPVIENSNQISALLDRGCEFEGKLTFEGTVRINGHFAGEIFSNDTLIIGDTAVLNAEIDVETIIISGEVNGNITARNRIEVHRPGVLRGNIVTPSLIIEEGVTFEGTCKMPKTTSRLEAVPLKNDSRVTGSEKKLQSI